MNTNFTHLSYNELLEKLSDYTLQYSSMFQMGGDRDEFDRLKESILDLQEEIWQRNNRVDDSLDIIPSRIHNPRRSSDS